MSIKSKIQWEGVRRNRGSRIRGGKKAQKGARGKERDRREKGQKKKKLHNDNDNNF